MPIRLIPQCDSFALSYRVATLAVALAQANGTEAQDELQNAVRLINGAFAILSGTAPHPEEVAAP